MTLEGGRLTGIFLKACTLPPQVRAAFLDEACAGDAALRAEVEAMLAADARAEAGEGTDELAAPVGNVAADAASTVPTPSPLPERIGPYRILERLGEGGMGVVYRAEQTEPVRRGVALKLVRTAIDSAGAVARFEAERQALAMMDHPNIAHLLDAGATGDGRPYFVMELVRGVPITEHCKAGRLTVRERVELFLDVCRAVRHAHRHGVIHRDLKPSNLLITRESDQAVPKVIDFSIAKALGEPALGARFRTRTGQLIGTLEYMSPEQALGRAVDTRSDVYALGVVLHELMADRLPHDVAGQPLLEAVRRIAEDPPRSLRGAATTATGRLDADIETIAGKCLEKDPDRRYGSAAELVEDLERYLDSRPIHARAPSAVYQLRKFVARHRVLFGAAALTLALLLVFSITVTIQLGAQRRERARAEASAEQARRAAARAERINAFLRDLIASASPWSLGRDATVREVLDRAAARLETTLQEEPEARADAHRTVGVAYFQLGDLTTAAKHLEKALEIHRTVHAGDHESVARDLVSLAELSSFLPDRSDEAYRIGQEGLSMWRRLLPEPHPEIADTLSILSLVSSGRMEGAEGERLSRDAVAMWEALPHPDELRMGEALARLTEVLWRRRKFAEAETPGRRAVERLTRALGPGHPATLDARNTLAVTLLNLPGREEESITMSRETLELARANLGSEHLSSATFAHNLALWLLLHFRFAEFLPLQEEARRIWRSVYGETHPNLAIAANNLAFMHHVMGDYAAAEEQYREMMAQHERLGTPPEALHAFNFGLLLHAFGGDAEAEPLLRDALDRDRKDAPEVDATRASLMNTLGCIAVDSGRLAEAERHLMEARESLTKIVNEGGVRAVNAVLLARLRALQGNEGESEALFEEVRDALFHSVPRQAQGWRHLLPLTTDFLASRGNAAEAARYREALERLNRIVRGEEPDWWKEESARPESDAGAAADPSPGGKP